MSWAQRSKTFFYVRKKHLHLQDRLKPATRTAAATISFNNQIISAQTVRSVSGKLICMLVQVPHRGLDLTAVHQLESANVHIWCCLALKRGVGSNMLWNTNTGAFWLHRERVTRSWGPLFCHSSTNITSCCSMIMHGPIYTIPGNWKHLSFCMANPLSRHVWKALDGVYDWWYPTSHSHLRGVDQHYTGHNQHPDQLNCVRRMVITADTDWFMDPRTPQYSKTAHFRVAFYCVQPKAHLCNNHVV